MSSDLSPRQPDHEPCGASRAPGEIAFAHYDPTDEHRREALLALGNGLLSTRASAPEAAAAGEAQLHYAGLYRAGWYDEAPRRANGLTVTLASLVNLPDPWGLSFRVAGETAWFTLATVDIEQYRQSLSLERGVLEREVVFRTDGGRHLRLQETRLLSMDRPHLGMLRWRLQPLEDSLQLRVRTTIDASVTNAAVERNAAYEGRRLRGTTADYLADGHAAVSAHLHDPGRRVCVATHTCLPGRAPRWDTCWHALRLNQETDCTVHAGDTLTVTKCFTVLTTPSPEHVSEGKSGFRQAAALLRDAPDNDALERAHVRAWQRLWQDMPIRASSAKTEQALRLHSYHLVQTLSPHSVGHDVGFPARGWQEGYFGQIFWDEIFAFTFLSTHFPAVAKTLIRYRHRRLEAARRRAHRLGLRGAMFPWRSGRSGEEETPPYQYNPLSGDWMPDHSCLQRHIGAAIAYNVWQYYLATGDAELLAREGGELVLEIARFWASLAQYDTHRERYVIRGVLGPDEYHDSYPGIDESGFANNAYTNIMAVWTLCRAQDLLDQLPSEQARELCQRLAITDNELRHWDHVSRRMYIPFNDEGVISQFEGFEALALPGEELQDADRSRADWLLQSRGESVNEYQLTKQADVLMMMHLLPPSTLRQLFQRLGYAFDQAASQRTADYYLARITHESSLSKVVCAGALACIDPRVSWDYYSVALRTDLEASPQGGIREGAHMGAMAGTLDVLQRHYLGAKPEIDGLHLFPAPPALLGDVSIALRYRGGRFTLALRDSVVTLTAHAANPQDTVIIHPEGTCRLSPGQHVAFPCREPHG